MWEVPQVSVEFSPFELLFRQHPDIFLDVLQEEWEETQEGPIPPSTYVTLLKGEAKRNSRVGKGDPHTGSSRPEVEV